MNYIFFDVDGVLNGTNEYGTWIDEDVQESKVKLLITLAKETNSKLVMSSTWRKCWNKNGDLIIPKENSILLDNLLKNNDCKLYSITPILNYERNEEIKMWLKNNTNANDNFVCFDDEYGYYIIDDFFKNRFIHTAPFHCNGAYGNGDVVGLFEHHIEKAKRILLKKIGEKKIMRKNIEVNVDIEIAKRMLNVAGYDTKYMSDDEIFNKVLEMNVMYGLNYNIIDIPNIRDKIQEYIKELDLEINRCMNLAEKKLSILNETRILDSYIFDAEYLNLERRMQTLLEVKNDLQNRFGEKK